MDIQFFLETLWKKRWMLLISIIFAAVGGFVSVEMQDDEFQAEATLSTGIIDYTGINTGKNNPFIQKLQVEMGFNNLIEFIQSRRCMNLLSFKLLLHDLQADPSNVINPSPFRQAIYPEDFDYTNIEIEIFASHLSNKLDSLQTEFETPEEERMFYELAKAYRYDFETLKKDHFVVKRSGETDYLKVFFVSENPELSAYAVNNFCQTFKDYHKSLQLQEDNSLVTLYADLAADKKSELTALQSQLNNFKQDESLVDINVQKESVVLQIKELELARQEANHNVKAAGKSLKELDRLLKSVKNEHLVTHHGEKYRKLSANKVIVNLQKQVDKLRQDYLASGEKDEDIKSRYELTRRELDKQLGKLSSLKPEEDASFSKAKESDLFKQRVDKQIEYTAAKEALLSLDLELKRLKKQATNYVSAESYVGNIENELSIVNKEYTALIDKLNDAKLLTAKDFNPLTIVEHAQIPDEKVPTFQTIISSFSGLVGGSFSAFIVFLFTLLDWTLRSPSKFRKLTGLPLLGALNKVNMKNIDLAGLFETPAPRADEVKFKESVRQLRYTIEQDTEAQVYLFTSTKEQQGKSFVIRALAHSLGLKGKKVLIMDTNFKHNSISAEANIAVHDNVEMKQLLYDTQLATHFSLTHFNSTEKVDVISNDGEKIVPSEVFDNLRFKVFLDELALKYDYIFLEGAPLNSSADTRELAEYADRVIALFGADMSVKQTDKESIDFLKGLGNQFLGAILNKVKN